MPARLFVVIGVKCNKPNPEKIDLSSSVFSAADKLDNVPPSMTIRSWLFNSAGCYPIDLDLIVIYIFIPKIIFRQLVTQNYAVIFSGEEIFQVLRFKGWVGVEKENL